MCFSSEASFVSSSVLFVLGFIGLYINYKCDQFYLRWKRKEKEEKVVLNILLKMKEESIYWWPFLFTPILFAIQQFSEGFVWIYLNQNMNPNPPGYCFSFFA